MNSGQSRFKLLLIIISCIISLALLEGGLRLAFKICNKDIKAFDAGFSMYRPHPFLGYALCPDYRLNNDTLKITVNHFGLRGEEFAAKKKEGVFRIIVVGGSAAFGHGLNDEDTWPRQLQKIFDRQLPLKKVEVINAGVDGYSTFHFLSFLATRLFDFEPDLIISYNVWNDLKYWSHLSPEKDFAFNGFAEIKPLPTSLDILVYSSYLATLAKRFQPIIYDKLRIASRDSEADATGNSASGDDGRNKDVLQYGQKIFSRNIGNLIALAQANNARVLLLNQLTLVNGQLSDEERAKVNWFIPEETLINCWEKANIVLKKQPEGLGSCILI